MTNAINEIRTWIDREGNDAQWRALQTALRSPRGLASSRLRNRKGPIQNRQMVSKPMSFTLDENTARWLNEHPQGMKSAVVEIALARYRLWAIMIEILDEMIKEVKE